MNEKEIKSEFNINIYGDLVPYNDVISKARARIFYKYANRNGTYISDEFANKLNSTLPYTPVKGIFSISENDYTDHGPSRDSGKIYGIVPENPNQSWESHVDEDGVERLYSCCDVLIFTGLYAEAKDIVSKSQSMEIYKPSIQGHWTEIDGQEYFEYTDGRFLGLQILGDKTEPCFEGAEFYSLLSSLQKLLNSVSHFSEKEEQIKMPDVTVALYENEQYQNVWNTLNPDAVQNNIVTFNKSILNIDDSTVKYYDRTDDTFYNTTYTVGDGTITLAEPAVLNFVPMEASAHESYTKLLEVIGTDFDAAIEKLNNYENLNQKIVEQDGIISTLKMENEQKDNTISTLTQDNEALKTYKLSIENAQKEAIIEKYSAKIPDLDLAQWKKIMKDYSVQDLEKELAFNLVNSNPAIFSLEDQTMRKLPKDEELTGMEALLQRQKEKRQED